MTNAELIAFLKAFTSEVQLRIWNGKVWTLVTAEAEYSARSGRTTIYLKPAIEEEA